MRKLTVADIRRLERSAAAHLMGPLPDPRVTARNKRIRAARQRGLTMEQLARRFRLGLTTVFHIVSERGYYARRAQSVNGERPKLTLQEENKPRNRRISAEYARGVRVTTLMQQFNLSPNAIYCILRAGRGQKAAQTT